MATMLSGANGVHGTGAASAPNGATRVTIPVPVPDDPAFDDLPEDDAGPASDPVLDDDADGDDIAPEPDSESDIDTDVEDQPAGPPPVKEAAAAVPGPDDSEEAFDAGRRARAADQSFDDHAYASGSRLKLRWERGWAYEDGAIAAKAGKPREDVSSSWFSSGRWRAAAEVSSAWYQGYDDAVSDAKLAGDASTAEPPAEGEGNPDEPEAETVESQAPAEETPAATAPAGVEGMRRVTVALADLEADLSAAQQRATEGRERLAELALKIADIDLAKKSLRDQYKGTIEEIQSARREAESIRQRMAAPLPLFDAPAPYAPAPEPPAGDQPPVAATQSPPAPAPARLDDSSPATDAALAEWRAKPIADALGMGRGITEKRLERLAELDPPVTTAGQLCDLINAGRLGDVRGFGGATIDAIQDAIMRTQPGMPITTRKPAEI